MRQADPTDGLEPIERAVLDMEFASDCLCAATLREQLLGCKVVRREHSSVGFFTHISPNPSAPRIENKGSVWFGRVYAEIEGLKHGAGFVVLISDGCVDMLEGYTYDEPWPDRIIGYTLRIPGTAEEHCAELRRALES